MGDPYCVDDIVKDDQTSPLYLPAAQPNRTVGPVQRGLSLLTPQLVQLGRKSAVELRT